MKVLILGSNGLLGHKLYQVLSPIFDVTGTIRGPYRDISRYAFFPQARIVPDTDVQDISRVATIIKETRPEVVINGVGIVKARAEQQGMLPNIWVNSLFPHQLYQVCQAQAIRLIHISTDCVFSGRKGNYREDDPSDAEDTYGKTKYLGEIDGAGALTIRISFIGRELASSHGLLEWFLTNQGSRVQGYSQAIFSGFPTIYLARIIADIIANHQGLSGIYHISSVPVSKFGLLNLIKTAMRLNIEIEEYPAYHCDRSLNSTRYQQETGFTPPVWEAMIDELARDTRQYLSWR